MKLKLIAAVLVAALFAYSGFWAFLAMNAGVYLENSKTGLRERGISVVYDDYSVSGFPYRFEVSFKNPVMEFKNGPLSYRIEAKKMEVVTHPWSMHHFILFPEQASAVLALGKTEEKRLFFQPEKTSISLSGLRPEKYRFSMVMEKVEVSSNFNFPWPEKFQDFEIHIRKEPPAAEIPVGLREPKILEIALEGAVPGGKTFLFSSSFRGTEVPKISKTGLEAWQTGGGTFEIEDFKIFDGRENISGNGSLTLDEQLRPLGSIGVKGTPGGLVSFFEGMGVIDREEADILKAFAATLPEMNQSQIVLPLTFQQGYLLLGPLRLKEAGPIIQELDRGSP